MTAKTKDHVLRSLYKGFGVNHAVEFSTDEERLLVVWHNPFSGRNACHVAIYWFDAEDNSWERRVNRLIDGTHDVSVETSSLRIRIRNVDDKVVYEQKWEGIAKDTGE